jgi:hypothetical protein
LELDMAVAYEMDESSFPLVVAVFRGPVQLDACDAFLGRLDSFCKERRHFSTIVDMSHGSAPSASERKYIAAGITSRRVALGRHCDGSAFVITNPLLRGAMTAILWVQPLPYPYEIFTTMEAARSYCAGLLKAAPTSTRSS